MTELNTDQLLAGEGTRKLATLRLVEAIAPHPNADRLEIVTVSNSTLQLVGGVGNYKVGDLVVLFEADSVLPNQLAVDVGLVDPASNDGNSYRVQARNMRGIRTHGYICPALLVSGLGCSGFECTPLLNSHDFSALLGVTKHVQELPTQLQGVVVTDGDLYSQGLIAKTDEERLSSNKFLMAYLREYGQAVQAVLKYDGSSMSVGKHNGKLVVASRKNWLDVDSPANSGNAFVNMAKQLNKDNKLLDALAEGEIVQGELCGPKIQGNKHGFTEKTFVAFQLWQISTQSFSSRASLSSLVSQIDSRAIVLAKLVKYWRADEFQDVTPTQLQDIANETGLEGIVVSSWLDRKYSFKVLNTQY